MLVHARASEAFSSRVFEQVSERLTSGTDGFTPHWVEVIVFSGLFLISQEK